MITIEQVTALAPDESSAAAGRKLGSPAHWRNLGRSEAALWGECAGGAVYQTRVHLPDSAAKCSCPSRKFPCKHALGLLFLAASEPAAVLESSPPEWVATWLAKREADAGKSRIAREDRAAGPSAEPSADAAKREGKREARVREGLDALDRWLSDLVRGGLASAGEQPAAHWERQAARMIDAQAPGVAARLRAMAAVPHATPDWPARLLDALGRLALLSEAYRNLDGLDPELREDVRAAIGWTLTQEEVAARGEVVRDDWLCLGRRETGEEKLRTRSTHLLGSSTGRHALVLQFSAAGRPWGDGAPVPGTRQEAELAYWPGASPRRALVRAAFSKPSPLAARLPGAATIGEHLRAVADALARQPWLDRFGCALSGVTPMLLEDGSWWVRDREGCGVPLAGRVHWALHALSGAAPVDLAGEWDGEALLPLGVLAEGRYHLLEGGVHGSARAGMGRPDELLRAALAGTSRSGGEPRTGTPVDGLLQGEREAERTLLLAAGARAVYRQAGRLARPLPAPAPAPADAQPTCSPAAALLGGLLARPRDALLPAALERLRAAGLRLPPELLRPALSLDQPQARAALLPVLGERGRWLAGQNPAWRWALDAAPQDGSDDAELERAWGEGAPPRRLAAIRRLRAGHPARAREWVSGAWRSEKAEFRAELLAVLEEGLSADDEPFLERALDDRGATVRARAARMLALLPASGLTQRMRARADALLPKPETWAARGSLRGLIRAVSGHIPVAVAVPEELPEDWRRDGVQPKPPHGTGERAWWLLQIVSLVPPQRWEERYDASVDDLLASAGGHEWGDALIEGWARAAVLHRDGRWAAALWERFRPSPGRGGNSPVSPDLRAQLLGTVPSGEAERLVARLLADQVRTTDARVSEALAALPTPWSGEFAEACLRSLRERARRARPMRTYQLDDWLAALPIAAHALPPESVAIALDAWELPEPTDWYTERWNREVATFVETLRTRQRIREEIRV